MVPSIQEASVKIVNVPWTKFENDSRAKTHCHLQIINALYVNDLMIKSKVVEVSSPERGVVITIIKLKNSGHGYVMTAIKDWDFLAMIPTVANVQLII
jgi:hypothetical protein